MDKYLLTILAVSMVMTAIGIFQNKKIFLVFFVAMSVLVGWYIQVIRVEFYNELAWEKFTQGTRASEPSDGASASFALLLGWIPSLALSTVIIGVQKLYKFSLAPHRTNTYSRTRLSHAADVSVKSLSL